MYNTHANAYRQTCGFPQHITYRHIFGLNAQMPFQETDRGSLWNSKISPMFIWAWAVGSSLLPLISNPAGLSSTRLGSLSQQRTTLLFTLYSSSKPCNWGRLTQRTLRLWWIAALKTTTKVGLCWSVVMQGIQAGVRVRFGIKQCVFCTVYYGIVCCPMYVPPWKPYVMS